MTRPVLALAALALLLLSACGQDLSKKTFERTTVPASATGAPEVHEPQLSEARLRLVDPCKALRRLRLGGYGTGDGEPSPTGYDECSRSLRTPSGKRIDITLTLGGALDAQLTPFRSRIAGLPASELAPVPKQCGEDVLTDSDTDQGISVLYVEEGSKTACTRAREVTGKVIGVLRNNPPQHSLGAGSLVTVQPCDSVDGGTVNAAMGTSPDGGEVNFRDCTWEDADGRLTVRFDLSPVGPQQSSTGGARSKVDLGRGVTGYKGPSETQTVPSCVVSWVHKRVGDRNEMPTVEYDDKSRSGADTCGKAVRVAKVLVTSLPKAG